MRTSVRRALWAGVAAVVVAAAVPVASAFGAGTVTTTFAATSDWGTGHEVRVTVANGSSAALASWRIEFDLPAGTTMSSFWDADVTRTGNHYVAVKKSWMGPLNPGASVNWGYVGTGAYRAPLNCTINGASCSTGTTPTNPPTGNPTNPPTGNPTNPPTGNPTNPPTNPPTGGKKLIGYFAEWGVYARNYHVKNIHTSGSAAKLTHILYAFGNTTGGRCSIGDSYADYEKAYTAADSVDGVADTWDQPLRGNFNQLRKLKRMYPNLKVIYSIGGWTWSGGFTQAAQNPAAFAESCHQMVEDPRWADVFDGIDIDWEYPNACGLSCDASGPNAFKNVMGALRTRFGSSALVTAAITADGTQRRQDRRDRLRRCRQQRQLVHAHDVRLLRCLRRAGTHRSALAADLVRRDSHRRVLLRRGDPEAEEQGRSGQQDHPGRRLLRPGLDRGDPGGAGRQRDRSRAGHL